MTEVMSLVVVSIHLLFLAGFVAFVMYWLDEFGFNFQETSVALRKSLPAIIKSVFPSKQRCDGNDDCGDDSDERDCRKYIFHFAQENQANSDSEGHHTHLTLYRTSKIDRLDKFIYTRNYGAY